jgi:hypothetical protein
MGRTLSATAASPRGLMIFGAAITIAASACAGSGGAVVSSGVVSCANRPASSYLASARVAFTGVMLPGPAVSTGQGSVLVSPARVRVTRYLKGSGPPIVTVVTAVILNDGGFSVSEDDIQPQAGQFWRIYAASQHMPYQIAACSGSVLLAPAA